MSAVLSAMPHFAPMRPHDVDEIVETEQRAYPYPWTRVNFMDSLASGYSAWVCRCGGSLIGYAVMMLVLDEAHLLNLTVAPDWQRRGYGMLIAHHLFSTARDHGAARMFLEVRPSNLAAVSLYEHCGFAPIGRRRGYYPADDRREDALVMARDL
jgi:ribosomal-protein-alanine N-acetyltransferase